MKDQKLTITPDIGSYIWNCDDMVDDLLFIKEMLQN